MKANFLRIGIIALCVGMTGAALAQQGGRGGGGGRSGSGGHDSSSVYAVEFEKRTGISAEYWANPSQAIRRGEHRRPRVHYRECGSVHYPDPVYGGPGYTVCGYAD